ncbi:hypothetical protein EWB00_009326 [Schistosoma japonicum]|uniref:Uncharacterized protein n=1 Tax=Schistosoma japonicum TaxID=6182 RepID=A0A4Z2CM57_SCHJA|nr:hypothetical protein EWB00_009326 [Schistosoma japonicum]
MGHQKDNSDLRNQGDRLSDKRSEDTSRHGKNGIRTESMFGSSHLDINTKKQGILMPEENPDHAVLEDMIWSTKPTNSKFKTRGKEKKYSRRINDNRFDIKGDLYERRQHVGIGDYQANGTHISVMLKTKEKSGSSNGTMIGRDSSSHSNSTQRSEQIIWGNP